MAGVDVDPSGLQLQNAYIPGYSSSGGPNFKKVISGGGPCVFRECPGAEYARWSGNSASSVRMLAGGFGLVVHFGLYGRAYLPSPLTLLA